MLTLHTTRRKMLLVRPLVEPAGPRAESQQQQQQQQLLAKGGEAKARAGELQRMTAVKQQQGAR
jgi:hypothetical protein